MAVEQAAESLVPYQDEDTAVLRSNPEYSRLSLEDLAEVLRLTKRGWTQRRIAEFIGVSQPAICYALKRMAGSGEDIQAVAKSRAIKALSKWEDAIDKASERGDHRPAREFIELAAPELRPQQGSNAGGVGVTIVIGQPGQPVSLPDVVVSTGLSPARAQLPSETDSDP